MIELGYEDEEICWDIVVEGENECAIWLRFVIEFKMNIYMYEIFKKLYFNN